MSIGALSPIIAGLRSLSTPQGEMLGIFTLNLAFSKDILKDKGTLSLNINDVLNSNKRIMEAYLPGVLSSRAEMQFKVRQIMLSLTYRFNKSKTEKERQPKRNSNEGGGDMDF